MFFVVLLAANFSNNLQCRGPFGAQVAMLFGVPGTFGNRLKTLKGIRFSHFGGPFCRYDFQARSGGCFFIAFLSIFNTFGAPFWVVFWDKNVNKWSMEKQAKNESNIFMRALQGIPGNPGTGPMWSLKRT